MKTVLIQPQSGLTAEEQQRLEDNCIGGEPTIVARDVGPSELIVRVGYALRHAGRDKIPLWVCEHVEDRELGDGVEHNGSWAADPVLVLRKAPRAVDADYAGSGFDRGHMSPNANFADDELRKQTYYFSNTVPQNGNLNKGKWARLEKEVRRWASASTDGVWVITGPLFYDPAEEDPATADGFVEYDVIGKGVAVPTHVFKVVIRRGEDGHEALAFVAENAPASERSLESFLVSIDWLEERAGLDLAPTLDDLDEAQVARALWP